MISKARSAINSTGAIYITEALVIALVIIGLNVLSCSSFSTMLTRRPISRATVSKLERFERSSMVDFESDIHASGKNDTSSIHVTIIEDNAGPSIPFGRSSVNEVDAVASSGGSSWDRMFRSLLEDMPPTSILLLNFVAIIWGSQHALIKMVVEDTQNPAALTMLRFSLAAIIASPYLPIFRDRINSMTTVKTDRAEKDELKSLRYGLELALYMFLGFATQAIGMQTTTSQRSAFLLYLNVKFVPFFAYLLLGRQISIATWVSAITAFTGTALLALDGTNASTSGVSMINTGDIWSILAAASSAMFILRLEKAATEVPNSAELNSTSLFFVAIFSCFWYLGVEMISPSSSNASVNLVDVIVSHPFELIYLGAISTALANFIQTKAQKDIKAERASIIYSLDPVYGAAFSYLLLGENLGSIQAYIGASMIFAAAATNSLLELSNERK